MVDVSDKAVQEALFHLDTPTCKGCTRWKRSWDSPRECDLYRRDDRVAEILRARIEADAKRIAELKPPRLAREHEEGRSKV